MDALEFYRRLCFESSPAAPSLGWIRGLAGLLMLCWCLDWGGTLGLYQLNSPVVPAEKKIHLPFCFLVLNYVAVIFLPLFPLNSEYICMRP